MLGSRASTIRDLLALAEPGWSSPSQSGSAGVPEGSPFAAFSYVPRRPAPMAKTRTGGPLATGVPFDPETSVGLLAAVAEPASARLLRVAEPARAVAPFAIMAAIMAADLISTGGRSNTVCYGGTRRGGPLGVIESLLACNLCRRRLDDRTIYIYMDKGFCKPECRYEYYLDELYQQRRKLAAEARASKRAWRHSTASLHTEAADRSFRRIFFAPDDPGSFR